MFEQKQHDLCLSLMTKSKQSVQRDRFGLANCGNGLLRVLRRLGMQLADSSFPPNCVKYEILENPDQIVPTVGRLEQKRLESFPELLYAS